MIAIVETGGKQFIVSPNTKIQAEKLTGDAGETITFDKVLLVAEEDGADLKIGTPEVTAKIAATVSRQFRTRKIMVRKFKNKVRYHRTAGHRQHKTEIKIESVTA